MLAGKTARPHTEREMRLTPPRTLAPATLVIASSLRNPVAENTTLWRRLHGRGLLQAKGGWLLTATLAGMLAAGLFALLSLLVWRRVLKPAIVLLLFASAVGGHFMWTYGIVIDSTMAVNTLQTDWREAR